MGVRPRSKLVLARKSRRCNRCGAKMNNQRTRCKKCSVRQALPKVKK